MNLFARQIQEAVDSGGPVIVLDPQALGYRLVSGCVEPIATADDWFGVRKWWENVGKNLPVTDTALLLVNSRELRSAKDVPPDILESTKIVEIVSRLSDQTAEILTRLPFELSEDLVTSETSDQEAIRAICKYFGLILETRLRPSDQIRNALVLRLREDVPNSIRERFSSITRHHLAEEILNDPTLTSMQIAWDDSIDNGSSTQDSSLIKELGPDLAPLFSLGLLELKSSAERLPEWAKFGVNDDDDTERIVESLGLLPGSDPEELEDWLSVAETIGEIRWRAAISGVGTEQRTSIQAQLGQLSQGFEEWIQRHHSELITRSSSIPISVANIADFLRKRLSSGQANRIALLVLDGLGMSQWAQIRHTTDITPIQSHQVLAVMPTVTSISRQSIFAGAFPRSFGDSIGFNTQEERLWKKFWFENAGLSEFEVAYRHAHGISGPENLDFGRSTVTGLVSLAIDHLGHSSTVFQDVQQIQGIDEWIKRGFLRDAIRQAQVEQVELWITSDHGNIYCEGIGPSNPGVLGERASTRVQLFHNSEARDNSGISGIRWDPSPTLPDNVFPLFASGTDAFTQRNRKLLTHGGLSIHEVVVPLVRVT